MPKILFTHLINYVKILRKKDELSIDTKHFKNNQEEKSERSPD